MANNNNTFVTTIAIVTALALLTLVITTQAQTAEAAKKPRIVICHVPEGEAPVNGTTKTLPAPAAAAHLRNHGDFPGPCPTDVIPPVVG